MSMLQRRCSIALATIVVGLLSSRGAEAQFNYPPSPTGPPLNFFYLLNTRLWWEGADKVHAEHKLQKLQAGVAPGYCYASDHESRRINNLMHRVAVDQWLCRKGLLQDPGCYPYSTLQGCCDERKFYWP
jgi:hypothetical protein